MTFKEIEARRQELNMLLDETDDTEKMYDIELELIQLYKLERLIKKGGTNYVGPGNN